MTATTIRTKRSLISVIREPVILGAADGVTITASLVAGLVVAHQPATAVWAAALSGGLAELVGMSSSRWQSDESNGIIDPLMCGVATCAAGVVPAIPYTFSSGAMAVTLSLILLVAVCGLIAWLRTNRGLVATLQTFGFTALAALICAVVQIR